MPLFVFSKFDTSKDAIQTFCYATEKEEPKMQTKNKNCTSLNYSNCYKQTQKPHPNRKTFNHINGNLYHYAGNNPVKYTDPTGMWIDNEDGTYTAEQGDTLWDLYGNDWQEKSGYEGDPTKLQVGDVVGKKRESHDLWESVNSTNTHGISKEQNSNDLAFSVGIGGKCALILGLGAEGGFIIDKSRNLYGYISGSIGCGIQTPSTTKVDLSTLQYLNNSKGISGSISLDPTQKGISSSLTADICLGIVGTYDLNNQKSSGLPNSWSFGSVGGGIWKTGTIVFPIYTNKRK